MLGSNFNVDSNYRMLLFISFIFVCPVLDEAYFNRVLRNTNFRAANAAHQGFRPNRKGWAELYEDFGRLFPLAATKTFDFASLSLYYECLRFISLHLPLVLAPIRR